MARDGIGESSLSPEAREALDVHRAAGRRFEAGGVRSFVREQGDARATPVVLVHGVPSSSFLYRKLIPRLADEGLRPLAFDFPGLGLAARPEDFDYSWSGLARWLGDAAGRAGRGALPPGGPRHRRADRLRVGGAEPGAGPLADGAEHPARSRHVQAAVVDAAVRDARHRPAIPADDPSGGLRMALPPAGSRRSPGDQPRRDRRLPPPAAPRRRRPQPSFGSCAPSS